MAPVPQALLFFTLGAVSFYAIAFLWNAELADRANWPLVDARVVQSRIVATREAQGVENRGVLQVDVRYRADSSAPMTAQLRIPGHVKSLGELADETYAGGATVRVRINPDDSSQAVPAHASGWGRWILAVVVALFFALCGMSALNKKAEIN